MSAVSDFYKKITYWNQEGNQPYLHKNPKDVGKIHNAPKSEDILNKINTYREKAYKDMRTEYKGKFVDNLLKNNTFSEGEANVLAKALKRDNSSSFKELDRVITDAYNEYFKGVQAKDIFNLNKEFSKDIKNINADKEVDTINSIVKYYNDIIDLSFNGKATEGLKLEANINNYENLKRQIGVIKNGTVISETEIKSFEAISKRMKYLIDKICQAKSGEVYNSKGDKVTDLSKYFRNIVDKTIAPTMIEAASSMGKQSVEISAKNFILKATRGNAVISGGDIDERGKQITADKKWENISISVKGIGGVNEGSVTATIGANIKFYRRNGFSSDNKAKGIFKMGSARQLLGDAIKEIFGTNEAKYYAYNNFSANFSNDYAKQIRDAIAVRQIGRAMSYSSASDDFSSVIYLNGAVYSVWEIIEKAVGAGTASSSRSKFLGGDSMIKSHISGLSNALKITRTPVNKNNNTIEDAWARSKNAYNAFYKCIIHLDFNPRAFLNLTK